MQRRAAISLIAVMIACNGHHAQSRPLEAEACAKLKADLTTLDEKGIREMLEKGPAAAKATSVSREQIRQVRQYLDLLGQTRFRCPLDSPIVVLRPEQPDDPTEAAAAGAPIEAGSPGITLPPGVAAATIAPLIAKAVPVPKVKAAPKNTAGVPPPVVVPAAAAQPVATVAPAKSKPKPKVDDALRPAAPVASPAAAPVATAPKGQPKTP